MLMKPCISIFSNPDNYRECNQGYHKRDDSANKHLVNSLFITVGFIIFLNIINALFNKPSWQMDRFINVDGEANFSAWFSGMILAIASFFAYQCSLAADKDKGGPMMFQLLALGLLGMSCDEVAMIHENMGLFVNKHFVKLEGLRSEWVALLAPVVLFIIIVFSVKMRKYLSSSNKAKKFLIIGAFIYIFGSTGLETLLNFPKQEILEKFLKVEFIVEEFCEMTGVILVIKGLIEHHRFLTHDAGSQGT